VGLYDATTGQLIDIAVTCFENKIVLDPTFHNKFYENRILRAELHGIEDLTGNNGTYLNWEFFVDRNELAWLTDSLGITKFEDEPKPGRQHPQPGRLPGAVHHPRDAPDWVHVVPNQGTLAPNEIRPGSVSRGFHAGFRALVGHHRAAHRNGPESLLHGRRRRLPIGVRVVCRPPYGPVNRRLYENTMSMVLKVNIEGVFSTDPEDIVAAYIDDELRGRANVQYVPQLNMPTWPT
jgi:hypothetical protein